MVKIMRMYLSNFLLLLAIFMSCQFIYAKDNPLPQVMKEKCENEKLKLKENLLGKDQEYQKSLAQYKMEISQLKKKKIDIEEEISKTEKRMVDIENAAFGRIQQTSEYQNALNDIWQRNRCARWLSPGSSPRLHSHTSVDNSA